MFSCLLEIYVPEDITVKANNAMELVRARAEAAAQGQQTQTSMQEDPALLQACLAVAKVRAAYRSNKIYTFDLSKLIQYNDVTTI